MKQTDKCRVYRHLFLIDWVGSVIYTFHETTELYLWFTLVTYLFPLLFLIGALIVAFLTLFQLLILFREFLQFGLKSVPNLKLQSFYINVLPNSEWIKLNSSSVVGFHWDKLLLLCHMEHFLDLLSVFACSIDLLTSKTNCISMCVLKCMLDKTQIVINDFDLCRRLACLKWIPLFVYDLLIGFLRFNISAII